MKILIIDDEPLIGKALSHTASLKGHTAKAAVSGTQGLKICLEWKPHLIFLDLILPDIMGLDLMKQIPQPRPPMVLMSAHSQYEKKAREKGALFVSKPFSNIFELMDQTLSYFYPNTPPKTQSL